MPTPTSHPSFLLLTRALHLRLALHSATARRTPALARIASASVDGLAAYSERPAAANDA